MTTPTPAKPPSWTSAEFWAHILVLLVLAATVLTSFLTAGEHHLPDWLPAVVAPLSIVLAVAAQGFYLLHVNGIGKKGWTAVEHLMQSDLATLGPALSTVAANVPDLAKRLDTAQTELAKTRDALATAQTPTPAPDAPRQ